MSFGTILECARKRIRRDPVLVLPFVVAGFVVGLADAIRAWDPIPVSRPEWVDKTFSVQYSFFPSGPARTVRESSALVDLEVPYALGAITLEFLVFIAVGLAGWMTISRSIAVERRLGSLSRYLAVFFVLGSIPVLFGPTSVTLSSLPLALLGLVVVSLVSARGFLFPGFLVRGDGIIAALKHSIQASTGAFWPLLSLVILFGLGYWVLAQVPLVGGFLSTTLVAPIHSVSLAVVLERRRTG